MPPLATRLAPEILRFTQRFTFIAQLCFQIERRLVLPEDLGAGVAATSGAGRMGAGAGFALAVFLGAGFALLARFDGASAAGSDISKAGAS